MKGMNLSGLAAMAMQRRSWQRPRWRSSRRLNPQPAARDCRQPRRPQAGPDRKRTSQEDLHRRSRQAFHAQPRRHLHDRASRCQPHLPPRRQDRSSRAPQSGGHPLDGAQQARLRDSRNERTQVHRQGCFPWVHPHGQGRPGRVLRTGGRGRHGPTGWSSATKKQPGFSAPSETTSAEQPTQTAHSDAAPETAG